MIAKLEKRIEDGFGSQAIYITIIYVGHSFWARQINSISDTFLVKKYGNKNKYKQDTWHTARKDNS